MACHAGPEAGALPSRGARLVVIDPNCSHCRTMHMRLNRERAVLRQKNIHVYVLNGTDADPLCFATRGGCAFPHCFEYTKNPGWARPFTGLSTNTAFISLV